MESISKKSRRVIEKHLEEPNGRHPLAEITRAGARMALQVAIEEELYMMLLQRDYYERKKQAGRRNGPFHSKILP